MESRNPDHWPRARTIRNEPPRGGPVRLIGEVISELFVQHGLGPVPAEPTSPLLPTLAEGAMR